MLSFARQYFLVLQVNHKFCLWFKPAFQMSHSKNRLYKVHEGILLYKVNSKYIASMTFILNKTLAIVYNQ